MKVCKREWNKKKSRIEILNEIYEQGTKRIFKKFSVERLIRSNREMKVYLKGNLTKETRI